MFMIAFWFPNATGKKMGEAQNTWQSYFLLVINAVSKLCAKVSQIPVAS